MNDSTWTWISGLNWSYPTWNYGEKGNASTANYPSGRAGAVGWYDSSLQEFWVFGGYGYGENIFAVFPVQEEGMLCHFSFELKLVERGGKNRLFE